MTVKEFNSYQALVVSTIQEMEFLKSCLGEIVAGVHHDFSGITVRDLVGFSDEEATALESQFQAAIRMTKVGARVGAFGRLQPLS